jgi:hypothetical protein
LIWQTLGPGARRDCHGDKHSGAHSADDGSFFLRFYFILFVHLDRIPAATVVGICVRVVLVAAISFCTRADTKPFLFLPKQILVFLFASQPLQRARRLMFYQYILYVCVYGRAHIVHAPQPLIFLLPSRKRDESDLLTCSQ